MAPWETSDPKTIWLHVKQTIRCRWNNSARSPFISQCLWGFFPLVSFFSALPMKRGVSPGDSVACVPRPLTELPHKPRRSVHSIQIFPASLLITNVCCIIAFITIQCSGEKSCFHFEAFIITLAPIIVRCQFCFMSSGPRRLAFPSLFHIGSFRTDVQWSIISDWFPSRRQSLNRMADCCNLRLTVVRSPGGKNMRFCSTPDEVETKC